MASVPGPDPDRPLPRPGAPAKEPAKEPDEDDRRIATPERQVEPPWMPRPYSPERETVEPEAPAVLP